MAAIVVPFRSAGKRRLTPLPEDLRASLALAMLADVLSACTAELSTFVVTGDEAARSLAEQVGAAVVDDPSGGQGAAVAAGLRAVDDGLVLVVNADLPTVTPGELRTLLQATPAHGNALAPAADGTTNALGLSAPSLFAPLYGAGSAERFRAHAARLGGRSVTVALPGLLADVDSYEDLLRSGRRAGPRTRAALSSLHAEALS